MEYIIKKATPVDLPLLKELFDYNDISAMIEENTRNILNGTIDIFLLFGDEKPLGELHVKYESEDEREAVRGRRVYLFAFRIREEYQGRGLGKRLLQSVIDTLCEQGCSEFTVGVEDDNDRARHIYERFCFDKVIARKYEEYQGDGYEYDLLLKKME
ncbi:MAG: GNAT family N-acetyltransferase [Eubacterium sp.]|nr:GNAT family N-acetyltransferase [Eubacterium sp.]